MGEDIDLVIRIVEVLGDSMLPTLKSGELLLYRKHKTDKLRVNQIVLVEIRGKKMIKRLMGVPKNRVQLLDGRLILDGIPVDEDFRRYSDSLEYVWELKNNEYLVLGDNGRDSLDSRKLGPIGSNAILGRIFLRLWPVGRLIS